MLLPNSRADGKAPDYDPGVTGQNLKPLLEQASVKPKVVSSPAKAGAHARKRRKVASDDEDEPQLIAAK